MQEQNQPPPTADPASLDNLHDIVVPDPVAWWPPAPGWYVLGGALLVVTGLIGFRALSLYRANRYRREARGQLEQLAKMSSEKGMRTEAIVQANELLKRVALAAWPRENVAALSGARWIEFLNRTGRDTNGDQSATRLGDLLYCRELSEQLTPAQVEGLFEAADRWICHHDGSISAILSEDEG